jgi:ankyrin repeat protein
VTTLLSEGADAAFADHDGLNAFHYAAQSGDDKTMLTILRANNANTVRLAGSRDEREKCTASLGIATLLRPC